MDNEDIESQKALEAAVEEAEDRINKGNALRFLINTEGWEILVNTFENMKEDQLDILSEQTPGDEKGILAAHAVWYSVVHTIDNIKSSVRNAIRDGEAARLELEQLKNQPTEDI